MRHISIQTVKNILKMENCHPKTISKVLFNYTRTDDLDEHIKKLNIQNNKLTLFETDKVNMSLYKWRPFDSIGITKINHLEVNKLIYGFLLNTNLIIIFSLNTRDYLDQMIF